MKRLVIAILNYVLVSATFAQKGFNLSGIFPENTRVDTVFLKRPLDRETSVIVKKTPVKNNSFMMSGNQDSTVVAFLTYKVHDGTVVRKDFLLQNGNIHFDFRSSVPTVSGTALNDSLQRIIAYRDSLLENWDKADERYEAATEDAKVRLKSVVAFWRTKTQDYTVDAILRNINNPLGLLLLSGYT